jgi:transcriptional regulator with XRE-family HTH domain
MNFKVEIGKRIKESREAMGLTLQELSARLNGVLSASRIGNYEQGTREPGPKEAVLLASKLNCSAAYLMCLDQDMTKQEQELLRNFRALPEKDRNSYARRIGALAIIYVEPLPDEREPKASAIRLPYKPRKNTPANA